MSSRTLPEGRPWLFKGAEDRGVKTKSSCNDNVAHSSLGELFLRNGHGTKEEGGSL